MRTIEQGMNKLSSCPSPRVALSFTYTANGKPSESSWEFFKIENEQMKTAQNNPYGLEKKMNGKRWSSKWTVNGK